MSEVSTAPLYVANPIDSPLLKDHDGKTRALEIWLKICSYTTCYCYACLMFMIITSAMATQYYLIYNGWYHHIAHPSFITSTYITFYFLQRNLRNFQPFTLYQRYNSKEFRVFVLCFMSMIAFIRYWPCVTTIMCPSSSEPRNIVATSLSFMVNVFVMYTLDLMVAYISLVIIHKYNELERRIQSEADIHIESVKKEFDEIQACIAEFKNKWALAVSVSCFYHIFFASVSAAIWTTKSSHNVWGYCTTDGWAQLLIVMTRSCVRIFGLVYGILRVNHKPRQLAQVINQHCDFGDQTQQPQIQRLVLHLMEFPAGFRVFGIKIQWDHFGRILLAAATGFFVSLAKRTLAAYL